MTLLPTTRKLREAKKAINLRPSLRRSNQLNSSINKSMDQSIEARFASAREEIRTFLPAIETLSGERCSCAIRRYTAAIMPNFVVWMSGAVVSCRSVEGRFAAAENVYVEIKDDHPGMLRDFAHHSRSDPDRADYEYVAPHVGKLQTEISNMSGLFLTTLMGVLENTSVEFVPWLARLSTKLGNTDLRYTDVHGEADAEHADQFQWALQKEAALHDDADETIDKAMKMGVEFLIAILNTAEA